MMNYTYSDSPVGRLLLYGEASCLQGLVFPGGKRPQEIGPHWRHDLEGFARVRNQLDLYFQGRLTRFDLAVDVKGTAFQRKVWQQLTKIPYGQTISYGELARDIGNPNAGRAVGLANGKNPIPIIIPCHRVIGKNGSLTGFGGGLAVKRFLLDLEQTQKG